MPFDWEKFSFEAVTEEEKAILHLFQQKHPEEFKKTQTRLPINREKSVCFMYGWFIGLQDGRFISDDIRMDLDAAFGMDLCKQCTEFYEDGICDYFPCDKIQPILKNGVKEVEK